MGFEQHLAKMDGLADAHLGETVFIVLPGLPAVEYKGFVEPVDNYDGRSFDETSMVWTLLISKAQFPVPNPQARMTCDRLDGVRRCAVWLTDENPRYWRVKLDKVA